MYISITHLELKSITKIFNFLAFTSAVQKQIIKANGMKAWEASGFYKHFWTRTAWESKEQMMEFMRSGAHANAMKNSKDMAEKVDVYGYESDTLPSWKEAKWLLRNHLK